MRDLKQALLDRSIPVTESGCLIWLGAANSRGYGHICTGKENGKKKYKDVHRLAYELFVGPIPEGFTIDHLCFVRPCINPNHFEAVTNRENNKRGNSCTAVNLRKTHCPKGHPYSKENTYINAKKPGHRDCRTCRKTVSDFYNTKARNDRDQIRRSVAVGQ